MRKPVSNSIVLYDGVCGLCNRGVQFLLKRDRHDQLRFASLQSEFATALLRQHGLDATRLDTFYVVTDYGRATESVRARADAVFFLARLVGGIWNLTRLLEVVPRWAANRAYDLVARHRYRFFGKHESCPVMDVRHRQKFLGEVENSGLL